MNSTRPRFSGYIIIFAHHKCSKTTKLLVPNQILCNVSTSSLWELFKLNCTMDLCVCVMWASVVVAWCSGALALPVL